MSDTTDTEQLRAQLIADGVTFLQSIAAVYGSERAQEVWSALGDAMGVDIKNEVFMYLLAYPDGGLQVRFQHTHASQNMIVSAIKSIRAASGLGLKEAKDLSDAAKYGFAAVRAANSEAARTLRRELRSFGLTVA